MTLKPIPRSRVRKMENDLVSLIWGKAAVRHMDRTDLAAILQCSTATVARRRTFPGTFTADELFKLCYALDINPAEIGNAFRGGCSA